MKTVTLTFDQRLLIMSMINQRKNVARERLREANPLMYDFWIKELTKTRNLKRVFIKAEFDL